MTRIDIFSGFLGAGKTTLIKKMIQEAFQGEKIVLIENEFGEIGIDSGFLKDAGIEITEMNSGCICCSLVGDFGEALKKVIHMYHPDRILIEPSGVGKLSDVIAAVRKVAEHGTYLGCAVAVADATKCKLYMKNFGEFYNNQIKTASCIVLSRTSAISDDKLKQAVDMIRKHNKTATLVTTPWEAITGTQLLEAMEGHAKLADELEQMTASCAAHHAEHHHGECCHHDEEHHHGHGENCIHHDEHHHDGECLHHGEEHQHHHCHEEENACTCYHHGEEHHHHHHHHHHHDADEVFTSWGKETAKRYTEDEIKAAMKAMDDAETYGTVLRAKGIVAAQDGRWIHFDHVPEESEVRYGTAEVIGRICVIGAQLKQEAIAELFGV